MFVIDPPATPAYVPSTQSVSYATVFCQLQPQPDGSYRVAVNANLLNAKKQGVPVDRQALPQMSDDDLAAMAVAVAAAVEKAMLPFVQKELGLANAVIK